MFINVKELIFLGDISLDIMYLVHCLEYLPRKSFLFNILWLNDNECFLFGKDLAEEKCVLPFKVLDY